MKIISYTCKRGPMLAIAASLIVLSGCAINMQVPLRDSVPSITKYDNPDNATPVTLFFSDGRSEENKASVLIGRIPMKLTVSDNKPFDPYPWLARNTVKELVARGLPVQLGSDDKGPNTVVIKRFQIENRRVSGFSPFETFTSLSTDVVTGKDTQRVVAFIKRGKVPVWSFDEVIDPTYNAPLDVVTKELAAKLNQLLFNAKFSDAKVDALIEKTNAANVDYRDVHELGFSNNPRAIAQLVKLSTHDDDEVFQAARSSLGVLHASQHFDLLVKQAENAADDWEDRAIALKAIGDLGTPEARAYLQKEQARLEKLTDEHSTRTKALLGLYLN